MVRFAPKRTFLLPESGRRLFERHGAPAYVARVTAFAAERARSLKEEDRRLIELEVRLAVGPKPAAPLVFDLIAAGYFWALFERWLDHPRRPWRMDPEERRVAGRSLVELYGISAENAALHVELAALKSGLEDLVPARDRTAQQRLAAFRDLQIEYFVKILPPIERPQEARSPGEPDATAWLAECFLWGVTIGLRRRLYDRDPRRAKKLLSPPS